MCCCSQVTNHMPDTIQHNLDRLTACLGLLMSFASSIQLAPPDGMHR